MAQNVGVAIAAGDPEVSVRRRQPAIVDRAHLDAPSAEVDGNRLRLTPMARPAFHAQLHVTVTTAMRCPEQGTIDERRIEWKIALIAHPAATGIAIQPWPPEAVSGQQE